MTNLQPTAASQWQRSTKLVTLPSGKVAEIKEIDLAGLILTAEEGAIPDIITQQMVDDLAGKTTQRSQKKSAEMELTAKDLPGLMGFVDMVVRSCMVTPRVVESGKVPDRDAGEIAIEDIDVTDRMFLFGDLMPSQEMATASRFRNGPATDVAIISEGKNLPEDAQ